MEEQNKDLQDYLISIRKRKTGILVIAATIMLIAAAVAFLLPPNYKSSATILIEQQEIPQELVMSTVTSYAAERIQMIQARVMSRANLLEIVDKFNLYADERKYETSEEILQKITDNISLDVISADVVDPQNRPTFNGNDRVFTVIRRGKSDNGPACRERARVTVFERESKKPHPESGRYIGFFSAGNYPA